MQTMTYVNSCSNHRLSFSGRTPFYLLTGLLALLIGVVGCAGGAKSEVKGTVKLKGENVAGQVVFVGSDGKEYVGGLLSGNYRIENVPPGEYKVRITGVGGPAMTKPGAKKGPDGKEIPDLLPNTGGTGVAPPMKYSKDGPENDLKATVKSSKDKIDFDPKP